MMKRGKPSVDGSISAVSNFLTFLGGVALIAMMLHITLDVVGRYLFNMPAPATLEVVTYYYMLAVVLFPLAALQRSVSGLVCVELFTSLLPRAISGILIVGATLVAAIYCAAAAYAAWQPAMDAFHAGSYVGSITQVTIWPARFFPVVGFGLLSVSLFAGLFFSLRNEHIGSWAKRFTSSGD